MRYSLSLPTLCFVAAHQVVYTGDALMRYSHDLPTLCFLAANEVVHAREGPLLGIANCCSHLYSSPYLLLGSHFWLWHIKYHSLTPLLFMACQLPFMHFHAQRHCPCHASL